MRFVAFVAVLLALTPSTARAVCRNVCSCSQPAAWVVSGRVESVTISDDAGTSTREQLRVERVLHALDGGPAVGSFVSAGFTPGMSFVQSDTTFGEPILDGGITCGNVRLTVEEYASMVRDGTCDMTLSARGFVEPPCNDVRVCGCNSVSPLLASLGLLVFALRRRASRA